MAFPFDKQKLRITLFNFNATMDDANIMPSADTHIQLRELPQKQNITPGWKIKKSR